MYLRSGQLIWVTEAIKIRCCTPTIRTPTFVGLKGFTTWWPPVSTAHQVCPSCARTTWSTGSWLTMRYPPLSRWTFSQNPNWAVEFGHLVSVITLVSTTYFTGIPIMAYTWLKPRIRRAPGQNRFWSRPAKG